MNILNYPLEQLLRIKNKRYEQALKVLEEKKEKLQKEETIYQKKIKERDEVLLHRQQKLQQLRSKMDEGTTSDKIQQMKTYLKVVEEKLEEKERKVKEQEKKVHEAKKEMEEAQKNLYDKLKDLEKLKIHKKEWEKEVQIMIKKEEEKEHDEIGTIRHARQKERKRKE